MRSAKWLRSPNVAARFGSIDEERPLIPFFVLLAVLSLPFWLVGSASDIPGFARVRVAACGSVRRGGCWQLFPNRGSHYDPPVTGVVTAIAAAMIGVVILSEAKDPQGPVRVLYRDGEDLRFAQDDIGVDG